MDLINIPGFPFESSMVQRFVILGSMDIGSGNRVEDAAVYSRTPCCTRECAVVVKVVIKLEVGVHDGVVTDRSVEGLKSSTAVVAFLGIVVNTLDKYEERICSVEFLHRCSKAWIFLEEDTCVDEDALGKLLFSVVSLLVLILRSVAAAVGSQVLCICCISL